MLWSCKNNNASKTAGLKEGTYTGYFVRSSPLARYASAKITITLKAGRFSGNSEKLIYPAIGEGTFRVIGSQLEFTDEKLWTADFDWSYILKGKFDLDVKGEHLELIKVDGENTDHYFLELTKN